MPSKLMQPVLQLGLTASARTTPTPLSRRFSLATPIYPRSSLRRFNLATPIYPRSSLRRFNLATPIYPRSSLRRFNLSVLCFSLTVKP